MREPRVGYLARLAVVVRMLAGVVFGNGVHCAGGMTDMAIEHAASSRMPAGTLGAFTAGAHRPVPDIVTYAPEVTVVALSSPAQLG